MAGIRKCVISLKRQHMDVDDIEDDIKLNSSVLAGIDSIISKEKELRRNNSKSLSSSSCSNSSSSSSYSTSSGSESDDSKKSNQQNQDIADNAVKGDVLGHVENAAPQEAGRSMAEVVEHVETVAAQEAGPSRKDSPQPGPSRYEDVVGIAASEGTAAMEDVDMAAYGGRGDGVQFYEDISSFEPLVTSTPRENREEYDPIFSNIKNEEVKNELRDGRMLVAQVQFDVLQDIRETLKSKSDKHFSKLREQRSKVSKRMADLIKQKRLIDALLNSLSAQRDDIDDAIHKFNYFLQNFPYSVE